MSDNGDEIRVEIYSDDEYINGQSVTPTGEPISSSSEEPLSVEAVSQEEQSVDEPIVEAQSIGDIPTPKAVEEESVRVQEVVDYIRAIDPIILEKIASVYGLKVDIYTEPVKRVLQEIGLVSATGEIPKFLKDKISGEFLIDENFKLALRKVLLDDEVELDKEYSLVTLENGKVYLLGKARYVLKQSGPELIYDAKVIGLAFELDCKLEGSGFGVYDESGQHTLYTDRLNVYDVVRIGDFGNQDFHGKSVVGKALVSDVAYMKGYFIISKDSIIDEQKGYTISDLLSQININSQNIGDANSNISAINNDLQNALQDIDTISSDISQLSGVVNSIIDDGLIDVKEKRALRITWNKLVNDKDIAKSNAEYFNIIEEKDDMLNAFYNLAYYLNNNQSYTVGYPYIINDDNINTPTTIDRTTYENIFNDFWDKLNILLDAIRVAINTSVNNVYKFAVGVNNYAISVNNELQLTKNTVSEISSDAYVTKSEKRELERILNEITADYNSDINHAQSYSIDTTSYTQAYDDLASYLLTIINDTNDTTAITREVFDTKFDTYFTERKNVIEQINLTVKTTADDLSDISAELMVNMSLIPLQAEEVIAKMNKLLEDGTVSQSEANVLQTISDNITKDYNTIETHLEILGQLGSQTFTDYTNAFNDIQDKLNTILTYLSQNPASDYVFSVQNDFTVQDLKDSIDLYYTEKKDAYGLIPFTLEYGLQDVQSTVQDAIQQAQKAIEDIDAMANDNIISRAEKKSLNREWTTIVNEVDVYKNYAIANGISSSDYVTAYINLGTFLNTNAPWTPGTTPNILYDIDNDSDITSLIYSSKSGGEALIEVFKDYYNSKIVLLNTIAYIANSAVRDIADDSVLTPSEKIALRTEWDRIVSEKTSLRSHSESVGVSVTDYDNAFTTLANYLNGGNTWSSGYPLWIDDNNYQDNTTIERMVFNSNINQYYYEANALRIAINNNVFSRLDDITSDNVLDASEKPSQRLEWETIEAERAGINAQADVFGITTEKTNYNNSFQTLADYLNGGTTWSSGVPLWLNDSNIGINTNIVGSTYRTNWRNFYTAKTALLNAIYDKVKQLADAAQMAADNAQIAADNAQTTANNAQASANTANTLLAEIANDNKLTPVEKSNVRREWDIIAAEKPVNDSQAVAFGITTEKATYGTKFQALADYLNNGTTWSSGVPSWISDANLGTNTSITGSTFRLKFREYYDARTALLNAIAAKAKALADIAQSTANSAQTAATNAQNTANTALTNANTALTQLTNIASDNILSPIEKQAVKREWDDIVNEKQKILDQAYPYYDVSTTAYTNAYNALNTYITPLLSNLNTDSTIDGPTFRSKFNTYYLERQNLLNSIAEQARRVAKNGGNFLDWQQLQLCNYPITSAAYTNFATGIYGDAAENAIVLAETPFGTMDKVWESNTAAADAGSGGGFNTTRYVRVDPNKSYVFYAWVKILDAGNVAVYYGLTPTSNKVINLNTGSMDSNPYFIGDAYNYKLPQNRWLLLTGIVHSKDYAGSGIGLSGIYDPLTKKRLSFTSHYVEFKWYDANVNSISVRVIRPHSCTINSKVQIYGVGIYEMNGQEPSVYSLLSAAKVSTIPVKPSDANLKAFYTFDKNMLFDDSGNGKGLTKYGTRSISQVASDIKGKCLFFDINDTNNGYLYIDDSNYFRIPELTISLWFKFTGFASGQTICGLFSMPFTPRVYIVYSTPTNYARAIVARTSDSASLTSSAFQIETNRWYHLTFVQKTGASGYSKLYINGNIVDVVLDNIKFGSGTKFMIGTDGNSETAYRFNGYIDELRFYNKALTDEEIAWLYLNPTQGLDYGSLKTIIDGGLVSSGTIQVGQGNDGDYTVKAGITGEGSADSSVRIWAGNTFTGRSVAPFRVQQDGTMYAKKGYIGSWEISDELLKSIIGTKELIIDPVSQTIKAKENGESKINISVNKIPSLSQLLSPISGSINIPYSISKAINTGINIETVYVDFNATNPGTYTLTSYWRYIGSTNGIDFVGFQMTVVIYLCDTNNNVIRQLSTYSTVVSQLMTNPPETNFSYNDYFQKNLGYINAGNYKLRFDYTMFDYSYIEYEDDQSGYSIGEPIIVYNNGSVYLGNFYTGFPLAKLDYTQYETGNMLGVDGLAIFYGAQKYMYLNTSAAYFLEMYGKMKIAGLGGGIHFEDDLMKFRGQWWGSKCKLVTVGSSTQVNDVTCQTVLFTGASGSSAPVIMPQHTFFRDQLGLGKTEKFAITMKMAYVGASNSVAIWGRNTNFSDQNTNDFPYMWNNNGSYSLSSAIVTLAKGDVAEFVFIYDGTTYYAIFVSLKQ